jgi:hypothetical protein
MTLVSVSRASIRTTRGPLSTLYLWNQRGKGGGRVGHKTEHNCTRTYYIMNISMSRRGAVILHKADPFYSSLPRRHCRGIGVRSTWDGQGSGIIVPKSSSILFSFTMWVRIIGTLFHGLGGWAGLPKCFNVPSTDI